MGIELKIGFASSTGGIGVPPEVVAQPVPAILTEKREGMNILLDILFAIENLEAVTSDNRRKYPTHPPSNSSMRQRALTMDGVRARQSYLRK